MKTVRYTGRIVRVVIVVLAIGLIVKLLVPANNGEASLQQTPNADATVQENVVANEATSEDGEPGTEEFGMSMEELVTTVEEVESLIADCMHEAGFEYIANDFNTVRAGMLADKAMPGLAEREFKATYGFGISTLYAEKPAPQLASESNPARIGLGKENIQLYQQLSPADQVAYNRTLLGEHTDATFAITIEGEDFSRTGGCTRAAIEQVFSAEELTMTYLNPRDAMYLQDPRMQTALKEYAECVRAAGYEYATPEEIEPNIANRFNAITGGAAVGGLSASAKAALEKLLQEERAIAVASFDCEHSIIHPVQDQLLNE